MEDKQRFICFTIIALLIVAVIICVFTPKNALDDLYEDSTKEQGVVTILDKYVRYSRKNMVKFEYKGIVGTERVTCAEFDQVVIGESYKARVTISKDGRILDMAFVKE